MTFPEQILGVPLALVEQGWRRQPDGKLWYYWQDVDGPNHPHWQLVKLGDGLKVARPVVDVLPNVTAYAHAGWGDGNAPTPEMCKVWDNWWLRNSYGELRTRWIRPVNDFDLMDGHVLNLDGFFFTGALPEGAAWLGPVLPPMRQS